MSLFVLLLGALLGIIALGMLFGILVLLQGRASQPLRRLGAKVRQSLDRLRGEVPWLDHDLTLLSGQEHSLHQTIFVSRHALAEGGLECPLCREQIHVGNFEHIFKTHVNGRINEVLVCPGRRVVHGGKELPCRTLLIASPDTEHGDHLRDDGTIDHTGEYDPDEFYVFRRVAAGQKLREKWGVDTIGVGETTDGEEIVDVPNKPPVDPSKADTAEMPAIQPAITGAEAPKETKP